MKNEIEIMTLRIPKKLRKLMTKYVERNIHLSESELLRDAIRTYIMTRAPYLESQLQEE